jgi:hypothetical protein
MSGDSFGSDGSVLVTHSPGQIKFLSLDGQRRRGESVADSVPYRVAPGVPSASLSRAHLRAVSLATPYPRGGGSFGRRPAASLPSGDPMRIGTGVAATAEPISELEEQTIRPATSPERSKGDKS